MCNQYQAAKAAGQLNAEERTLVKSQQIMQKYSYYLKRFKDGADAIYLTHKLKSKMEMGIRRLTAAAANVRVGFFFFFSCFPREI